MSHFREPELSTWPSRSHDFPLEILLGLENGFTPAAASRVGQHAACGSSQGRTLEMIADQMGTKIGTEKVE